MNSLYFSRTVNFEKKNSNLRFGGSYGESGFTEGPTLPHNMHSFCAVEIEMGEILVAGGIPVGATVKIRLYRDTG